MNKKAKKISLKRRVKSALSGQRLRDPRDFLSPQRIDIAAKTIFARAYLEGNTSSWPEYVYREHIRAFNNFHEGEPKKDTYASFKDSFIRTIEGVKDRDAWKSKHPVINHGDRLINGAHRVAASIVLGDKVNAKHYKKEGDDTYNYKFFSQDRPDIYAIDEDVLDYITIEYTSLKKNNIFIAIIFPTAEGFRQEAYEHLIKLGEIVNMKVFKHDEFIGKEIIKQLYFNSNNDEWNYGLDFESAQYKADLCFAGTGDLEVYVIEANLDELTRIKEKQYLRSLWSKDKHSIHITDTIEEANRVVRMFFNKNSRDFLKNNRSQEFASQNMYDIFDEYIKLAPKDILKRDNIAIEGSAVLDLYNIRPGRDIDYISRDPGINFKSSSIEKHSPEEVLYHSVGIDELLTNPGYFFYYKGYKFITLKELKKHKENRYKSTHDRKDRDDIKLIDKAIQAKVSSASLIKHPLVSIIIPVYNTPKKYLQPCLDSVSSQVYPNLEVIIVDDGSDDVTAKFLDEYVKSRQDWIVIHQKNTGLSGARNAGYKEAKGVYIQFLDADDFFDERLVSSAVYRAQQTGADIVVENFTIKDYDTGAETVVLKKEQLPEANIFRLADLSCGKIGTIPFNVWSKLFKKSFLDNHGMFHDHNLKRAEDVLFSYSALVSAERISFLEPPYIVYRENLPQSNTKNNDAFPDESVKAWNKLYDYLCDKKVYDVYEDDFKNAMSLSLLWHLDRLKTKKGVDVFISQARKLLEIIKIDSSQELIRKIDIADINYDAYKALRDMEEVSSSKDKKIAELTQLVKEQEDTIRGLLFPGIKTSSRKLAGSIRRCVCHLLKIN